MSDRRRIGRLEFVPESIGASMMLTAPVQKARPSEARAGGSIGQLTAPLNHAIEDEALPHFLVSYELGPDWTAEDYKELYRVLRSFRSWTWVLDSVWVLQATSADFVRSVIRPLLDASDGLVVMQVTNPSDEVIDGEAFRPATSSRLGQVLSEVAFG